MSVRKAANSLELSYEENEGLSVRKAANSLELSYETVRKILNKDLAWKYYQIPQATSLSHIHIESRLSACKLQIMALAFRRVVAENYMDR